MSSVKTVLARWLPPAIASRLGLVRESSLAKVYSNYFWGLRTGPALLVFDAYEKVGWVYRAVRAHSDNVKQVPFYAVRIVGGKGKGRVERLPDLHPLSQLLARPNEEEDFSDIIESTVSNLNLYGEALWELVPGADGLATPGKGRVSQIFSHPMRWLWKVDIADDKYQNFRIQAQGYRIDIPGDRAAFFKLFNPRDPWRGLAPLAAAYQAADSYYAASLFNAKTFENAGTPSLAITLGKDSPVGDLTEAQRNRIRAEIQSFHAGIQQSHGVMVLGQGEDVKKIGADIKDMSFETLMKFSKDEILAVFGVPPILMADVQNANRSNSGEQRKMFWQETLIPEIEDIVSHANRKVSSRFGQGILIQPDYSQVPALRIDLKSVADGVVPWIEAMAMTINEARTSYLDLPPVEWGDDPWHQNTLEQYGQEPEPAMPTQLNPPTPPSPEDNGKQDGKDGQDGAKSENNKLTPGAAKKLLSDWKNAAICRIRAGAKTPLHAFPPGYEARHAARSYNIPRKMAWDLARAVSLEMATFWNKDMPEGAMADLFDRNIEHISKK